MKIQSNYVNYNTQNKTRSNRTNAIGFGNKKLELINSVSNQTREVVEQLAKKMLSEGKTSQVAQAEDGTKLTFRRISNNFYNLTAKKGSKSTNVNIDSHSMSISKVNPDKAEAEKYNTIGGIGLANIEVRGYLNNFLVDAQPKNNNFFSIIKKALGFKQN